MGSARYDRAITVFSPDGHLFQVEYAQEAVKKGSTAVSLSLHVITWVPSWIGCSILWQVGVRGKDLVVLGVEKKSVAKLQEERTVRKICLLDDHVVMAFAGLTADARILINRARIECQSHKLTVEDPVTLEYITRYIAGILFVMPSFMKWWCWFHGSHMSPGLKQKYTQSNGRRPFGISCLIAGFDYDGTPHLFQTDPSGTYHEWKVIVLKHSFTWSSLTPWWSQANATGRNAKTVREFLEKNYNLDEMADEEKVIKLAIRALLEVVQSGSKNLELAIMRRGQPMKMLDVAEIEKHVVAVEKEKEEEAEKKKQKKWATSNCLSRVRYILLNISKYIHWKEL